MNAIEVAEERMSFIERPWARNKGKWGSGIRTSMVFLGIRMLDQSNSSPMHIIQSEKQCKWL
jgi:hypothetical protein